MQVFKVFFKITKKNFAILAMYMVIFIAITVSMSIFNTKTASGSFMASRCDIAVINYDDDTELLQGFMDFLEKKANIVELEDKPEVLQDALFFRKADYILKIPKGFTESFLSGNMMTFEKTAVPDSTAAMYMDVLIDNFFNTAKIYSTALPGIFQAELVEKTANDTSLETKVAIRTSTDSKASDSSMSYFFNFSAYSMLAILILGVSTFMLVINKTDLKRRSLCSPLSQKSINSQSLLANLMFALLVSAVMLVCAAILFRGQLFTLNGLLFAVNLLIFMSVALSLSFLLGSIIKNKSAQNAAANTLSLGMSFISGVFVPQSMLGESVKTLASFTPVYWFVKANDKIGSIADLDGDSLAILFKCWFIQLLFAAGLIALTFFLTRQRKNKQKHKS